MGSGVIIDERVPYPGRPAQKELLKPEGAGGVDRSGWCWQAGASGGGDGGGSFGQAGGNGGEAAGTGGGGATARGG